jgi:hypothetical protein
MKNSGWSVLGMLLLFSACSTTGVTSIPVSSPPVTGSIQTVPVGIPHEYIPAPGWCRVWHPERSASEQPQPERCLEIFDVPAGAWVVYGGAMIKTYRVEEYDPLKPGVVNYINYFELESGRFLRQEKICDQDVP